MLNVYQRAEVSFSLNKEIGQAGKNSKTYMAHDAHLDAEIVIKQIEKSKIDSEEYFNESRTLYLSTHPNVVQIMYASENESNIFIAMPFYRRGSLNDLMNTRFLTVREIIASACQVVSGLHNIHSKGLIHFDVKPDNILLSDRGEALLSDFGLTKKMNVSGEAEQDRFYGKNIPPEVLKSQKLTVGFDIYQFGLTLYRMANGNKRFYDQFNRYSSNGTFNRELFRYDLRNGKFPDRAVFLEHIPQKLRNVIKKCLEPDVDSRYSAAIEVANDLADISGEALDWRYSEDTDGRNWRKMAGGTEYVLGVDTDGAARCTSQKVGSAERRITAYCKDAISTREIKKFLGEY